MKFFRLCLLVLVTQLSVACTSTTLLTPAQKKQVRQRAQLVKDQLPYIQAEILEQRSAGALLVVHGQAPPSIDLTRHLFPGASPIAVGLALEGKDQLDASIPDAAHVCYWFDDPGLNLEPRVESCGQLRSRIAAASATTDRLDKLRQNLQDLQQLAESLEESLQDVENEVGTLDREAYLLQERVLGQEGLLATYRQALTKLQQWSGDLDNVYRGSSDDVRQTLDRVHRMADLLDQKAKAWQRQMDDAILAFRNARSPE